MTPYGRSAPCRSTIGKGGSIASCVLTNQKVWIMSSMRLAGPISVLCIASLRRGGMVVGFGFMGASSVLSKLVMFGNLFIGARLRGRRGDFYGISALYKKDPRPLRENLPKIFALLAEKKIDPLVARTFPLLQARQAIELLASGPVEGKIVLTND